MIKNYINMLRLEFRGYNVKSFLSDVLAGITVTAVALPLALAFGVSCGASAAAGLVTAIIAGIFISALSGASFQISGPTGAMSAILIGIVSSSLGLDGVFVVSFLAGILVLLCGVFRLGKLVAYIPKPVITGFTSGIALIIAIGQLENFFGVTLSGEGNIGKLFNFIAGGFLKTSLPAFIVGLSVVAIMIIYNSRLTDFIPKKIKGSIPASLLSLIIVTAVVNIIGLDISYVGEIPNSIFLEDRLDFTTIDLSRIFEYISPAISVAALAMIESLLCGEAASKMSKEPFDANIELCAQGVGNMVIPLFGGVPATAAIARTSVALGAGAKTRVCGIVHALGLLLSMLLLTPIMARIPHAALAGVLMVTAYKMNEKKEIKSFFTGKHIIAVFEFTITMIATVLFDLTVAIVIGIAFSLISFIAKSKFKLERAKISADEEICIEGPVFFGNLPKIKKELAKVFSEDREHYKLDLSAVTRTDFSAIKFFEELKEEHEGSVELTFKEGSALQKALSE